MPIGNDDLKMIEDGKNLFRGAPCKSFVVADDTTNGNRRSLYGCLVTGEHETHEVHGTDIHTAAGDAWYKEAHEDGHWQHEGDVLVELNMAGA
jgi:hypothetical protein